MTTIALPPEPPEVPPLVVHPGAIRACGADLLTASAQVDDVGTFVAGEARIGDWTGQGSTAYHEAITPIGRRADAMSLALRGVARRVDAHADQMQALEARHGDLEDRRATLAQQVALLRDRATGATGDEAAAIQADCDRVRTQVETFDADVTTWLDDLSAEEAEMVEAFARVMTLDQVDRRYGGVVDPADAALATRPPAGASPEDVNRWWDGLTSAQHQAIIAAAPGAIGNLDGIPAWARGAANTVALDRDLADWGLLEERGLLTDDERTWLDNARAAEEAIGSIESEKDLLTDEHIPTQLYLYDPTAFDGDGAVAISAGRLDDAAHIAVTVPGFGTDAQSADYQADRALTIYESTRYLGEGDSVASMFWIGYDAPDNFPWEGEGSDFVGVGAEAMATEGGDRLADTLDGLRASRDGEPAHLTVVGHSYGSTTTGHAAHDHGIPVDDLVFVGSPGVGGDTNAAADTGIDPAHVWAGASSRDPIANLGNHGWIHGETLGGAGLGDDPVEDDFGATRFQAESTTRADNDGLLTAMGDHSKYFNHDTESLYNISQIVNGNYDAVVTAGHVTDPWHNDPRDPEWDRDPTAPDTWEQP